MENPKVDFIFGLHIGADRPSNVFGLRGEPIMAVQIRSRLQSREKADTGLNPTKRLTPYSSPLK